MSLIDKYRTNPSQDIKSSSIPEAAPKKSYSSLIEKYRQPSAMSQDSIYQNYATPDIDSTQLTGRERYQYAQDLVLEREYLSSAGFVKNALSKATFGKSEQGVPDATIPFPKSLQGAENLIQGVLAIKQGKIDKNALKPQDYENNQFLGSAAGIALPFAGIATPAGQALSAGARLLNLGKIGQYAAGVAGSAFGGGAYEGIRQQASNEQFDPTKIAEEAAIMGVGHIALSALASAGKGALKLGKWLKGLKPEQEANLLAEGIIPKDLEPNQYKFFQDEVVPELRQLAESEFKAAQEASVAENNAAYQQQLRRAQIEHEAILRETGAENAQAQEQYSNKLKQLAAEHQNKLSDIEQANKSAMQEFQEFDQAFQQQRAREQAVQNALNPSAPTNGNSLAGRVTNFAPDSGIRPANPPARPTLETIALNRISPNVISNKTNAGRTQGETLRGHAAIDYRNVNELYATDEALNTNIFAERPELVQDLQGTIAEINAIPAPSPPQVQLRNAAQAILDRIATVSEEGVVTGYMPISNQSLLEQAKALRYYMDFEFAHANPKGIFQPTLGAIDNAVENAAIAAGDVEAFESNRAARRAYREWTDLYNNDYVNPYRNRTNYDYIGNFDKSLNIDNFSVINRALGRSNIGQQVADTTRRALVDKHLSKFLKDPHGTTVGDFTKALAELDPVTTAAQRQEIRSDYLAAKRSVRYATKAQKIEQPKNAKTNAPITEQAIPKAPVKKKVTEAKIPVKEKPKITTEMKEAAAKMKITPEETLKLTDSPSGLKELRSRVSKTTFEKIGRHKVKNLLYEGSVEKRLKGDELVRVINKADNYALLAEILGESETKELLKASQEIGSKRLTLDNGKKYLLPSTIKTLLIFGLF